MERFNRLFELFEAQGHELYLVGGCVRDLLMARAPKDYDFATSAPPEAIKQTLRRGRLRAIPIGEAFGTVATQVEGEEVEITTYRVKESYQKGSRHPVVVFGDSLEADLSRRDLTINAMAMGRDGVVVDPFGGQADLAAGVLRVPGGGLDKTREIFADDPLRMLRVGRFVARYGFAPDEATTQGARQAAETILEVSRERWESEYTRLLQAVKVSEGLRWLEAVGVLEVTLPEWEGLRALEAQPGAPRLAREARERTLAVVEALPGALEVRWAGMLHAFGWPGALAAGEGEAAVAARSAARADEVARRLRFSNEARAAVMGMVAHHDLLTRRQDVTTRRPDVRRVMLALEAARDGGARLDATLALAQEVAARHPDAATRRDADARRERFSAARHVLEAGGALAPTLPTGLGHALVELGVERGPALGRAFAWLRDRIIEEQLPNEAEARVYLEAARGWLAGERD